MSLSSEVVPGHRPPQVRPTGSSRVWRIAGALTFLLAVLIALGSYRYVLGLPPIPDGIAANAFRTPWLVLHAGSASTALLLGALQFTAVPRWGGVPVHRMVGRVYVVSCLAGSLSGFVLAIGTSSGIVAAFGFGSLAVAWGGANVLGWRQAVSGRIVSHRRWMIRSWALTLSAVTLRLYLPASEIVDLPEAVSYPAISFLCWVPNLILAELLIRTGRPVLEYRSVIGSRSP